MTEDVGRLYLISANKSRIGNFEWSADDYDVREGVRRGTAETREEAMAAFKAQWMKLRG